MTKYNSYLQVKTDDDTKKKLKELCAKSERDMSKMVRFLIIREWTRVIEGKKES
jgi:antitoxin component of RelBE/YafQ-DinJ toxin-antitoxin module